MEAPAPRHRSRILGRSSMFRFFRSLVGGKSSPQCSAKGGACPSPEPATVSPVMGCQPGEEGKEPRAPSTLPCSPPMATSKGSLRLLQHGQECLGMGDVWAQNLAPTMILWAEAQGQEVEPGLARGHPSEKEEEEEAAAVRQASRNTGASIRGHLAQALEVQPEPLQKAEGPLEVSRKALAKESQDDGRGDSLEPSSQPVQAAPETGLGQGIVPLQSPLHKTFRSTDTVGFVESELKTLLAVQRESRLWKMGAQEGRELLAQPEITLEEAGIVDGQHLLLEEKDAMGNWPPE
ncbi:gametogenetin-binding protein 1-like isoform X3 [Tenrec ecaudatus]|uniref:gametogenetin-binding protein 1-like isoform X3 n=1 Tax=Tenrec ecaudatus TaxID=94439 RepID=UPI003F591F05